MVRRLAAERLIPLIIVPLWDAELAAAEVRRNAGAGCHAVCFCEIPPHLGPARRSTAASGTRSSQACQDTETVVSMHIGSLVADAGHLARRAGGGGRPR